MFDHSRRLSRVEPQRRMASSALPRRAVCDFALASPYPLPLPKMLLTHDGKKQIRSSKPMKEWGTHNRDRLVRSLQLYGFGRWPRIRKEAGASIRPLEASIVVVFVVVVAVVGFVAECRRLTRSLLLPSWWCHRTKLVFFTRRYTHSP